MKKLDKAQIRFIDNYLDNSGVTYLDVRMEMVDHVATAIESEMKDNETANFYTIFRNYMVQNKKALLESHKQFSKQAIHKLHHQLMTLFFSLKSLVVVTIITTLIYLGLHDVNADVSGGVISEIILILTITYGLAYITALKFFRFERIPSILRLGFLYIILLHFGVFFIEEIIEGLLLKGINFMVFSVIMALIITAIIVFISVSVTTFKNIRNRYKALA